MKRILLIFIFSTIIYQNIQSHDITSIQFDYSVMNGLDCFAIGTMQYEILGYRKGINKSFKVTDKSDIKKISESLNTLKMYDIDDGHFSFRGKITLYYKDTDTKICVYFNNTIQIGLCGAYYKRSNIFEQTINDIFLKYQGIKFYNHLYK